MLKYHIINETYKSATLNLLKKKFSTVTWVDLHITSGKVTTGFKLTKNTVFAAVCLTKLHKQLVCCLVTCYWIKDLVHSLKIKESDLSVQCSKI